MEDTKIVDVEVSWEGRRLHRTVAVRDGALPPDVDLWLQDMVDTLLEEQKVL